MSDFQEAAEGLRKWLEHQSHDLPRGGWLYYTSRVYLGEDGTFTVENESLLPAENAEAVQAYEIHSSGKYEGNPPFTAQRFVYTHDVCRAGTFKPIAGGSFRGERGRVRAALLCEMLNRAVKKETANA